DQQSRIGNAQLFKKPIQHFDDFGFDCRVIGVADDLGTDLVELAETTCLWVFAPKLWTDIEKLYKISFDPHLVLNKGANDWCSIFRPKCKAFSCSPLSCFINTGVHLFINYVRRLADTARKQLCFFEYRCTNLFKTVAAKRLARFVLDKLPAMNLLTRFISVGCW